MSALILLLCIQLVAYPIIAIMLLRSIFKKNIPQIKRSSIWLVVLLLFSGFVFKVLPGSDLFWWPINAHYSKKHTESLTGQSFVLTNPIYEWHSGRGMFMQDLSAISIYKLEKNVNQYFSNPDSIFFTDYPSIELSNRWGVVKWQHTPIKTEHIYAFNFANYNENTSSYYLDKLLNEDGNYYSFIYDRNTFLDGGEHYSDVSFYIICPKKEILIVLNHNI